MSTISLAFNYLKNDSSNKMEYHSTNYSSDHDSSLTKVIPDWEIKIMNGQKIQTMHMTVSVGKEYLIGRSENCHLTLEDPYVSRQQLRVYRDDKGYYVQVLGKTNTTFVNDKEVNYFHLENGLEVQFGHTKLLFKEKPVHSSFSNNSDSLPDGKTKLYKKESKVENSN